VVMSIELGVFLVKGRCKWRYRRNALTPVVGSREDEKLEFQYVLKGSLCSPYLSSYWTGSFSVHYRLSGRYFQAPSCYLC